MRRLIYSLLPLLVCVPALAQDLAAEAAEEQEIRRYTVEVIIFRYAQDVSTGSEVFLGDEIEYIELPVEEEIEALEPGPEMPAEEPEPLPDIELVLLEEDEYQLGETLGRLERLEVYEPVMHFGWTQATWPEEQTEAISLHRFARPPQGLDGSLTLYLSRYLHLVVDLELDAESAPAGINDDGQRLGDMQSESGLVGYVDERPTRGPVRYRIEENRILKSGELRYYDHPKFGVLAMVTRVEDKVDDPAAEELLGYGTE